MAHSGDRRAIAEGGAVCRVRSAVVPLTARVRGAARRAEVWCAAVLVAALIAFGWQSFVTQTHLDVALAPATAAHVAGAKLSPTQPAPEQPIDCPICHANAIGGHYLAPGPALVLAPVALAAWLFVTAKRMPSRRARSHAWRSRAPPQTHR